MKYFAKLGLNSKVISHTHVSDEDAPTEKEGIEFLNKTQNYPFWAQCFRDGTRKHYPHNGFIFDEDKDAFIPPQPKNFFSWTLNEATCAWEAPTSAPDDGKKYKWNEEIKSWEEEILG